MGVISPTADGTVIARIRPATPKQSITGSTQVRRLADLADQASAIKADKQR